MSQRILLKSLRKSKSGVSKLITMANYKIIFLGFLFLFFSCEGETVYHPDKNPCPEGQIQVKTLQSIKFTDTEGNWVGNIDYANLSLIATDSLWNYQYAPNGDLMADIPNALEVQKELDEDGEPFFMELVLGHVPYRNEVSKTARGYFLLKIDDNTFDEIIGYYDTECYNLLLEKISYNGVEYPATGFTPIEIIKEE